MVIENLKSRERNMEAKIELSPKDGRGDVALTSTSGIQKTAMYFIAEC